MIYFIDINTGNIFDGQKPYCFWFDEGQSTGLNYVKQICYVSNKERSEIELNSDKFKVLDLHYKINSCIPGPNNANTTIENINSFDYNNLQELIAQSNHINYGKQFVIKENMSIVYIHMLYIVANSDIAGEFQDIIKIENEEFLIGADFYNENELLKSNLQNIGFEIPDAVQKAIYEVNLHEESRDNITLNRKFKELLLEHVNILSNKGSYNSLINSLNWFEYGDLVKIQEYWKNTSNIFYCKNLTNILTDELSDLLQSHIKTTYIGLYLALNKFKYDENGNLLYAVPPTTKTTVNGVDLFSARLNKPLTKENPKQDRILQIGDKNVVISDFKNSNGETVQAPNGKAGSNWKRLAQGLIPEPVPQLEYISALFSKEELSLKMALLGNFYATYFMPIHLDLIHSTIENIIFTDTIKLSNFNRISRLDYINNTQSFNASIDNSKRYYLENISISANNNTNLNAGESLTGTDIKRFGVDLLSNLTAISSNEYNLFYQQYYTGIGCIVPINFEVKFDEDNEFIQKVNLIENYIENDKLETIYKSFDIIIKPEKNKITNYIFNLLFTKAQKYNIALEFVLNNGFTYSKNFEIEIYDNTYSDIDIYKLQKLSVEEINSILDRGTPNWNYFAFTTDNDSVNNYYRQYITSNNSVTNNGAGVTHVFRQKLYQFNDINEFTSYFDNKTYKKVREELLQEFDSSGDYYYDIMIREDVTNNITIKDDVNIESINKVNNIVISLIGIHKHFTIESKTLVLKDFWNTPYVVYKNGNKWESYFKIIQENDKIMIDYKDIDNIEVYKNNIKQNTLEISVIKNDVIKYKLLKDDMMFEQVVVAKDLVEVCDNKLEYYPYKSLNNHSYYKFEDNKLIVHNINGSTVKSQELFLPQFHKLISLDDYKVGQDDTLCVIPRFAHTKNYGDVSKPVWKFCNNSTNEEITIKSKTTNKYLSLLGPYIGKF